MHIRSVIEQKDRENRIGPTVNIILSLRYINLSHD